MTEIDLYFELDESDDPAALTSRAASKLGISPDSLPPLEIKRRAIDARHGKVRFLFTIGPVSEDPITPVFQSLKACHGEPVLIIGAGPAGLFCAYELARVGIKSIIFERGKKVQPRRHDLKDLNQHGVVNPDSNYCFGEGGAGTYSDGKLYTRSHKRGDIRDVLHILVAHGAPEEILVDARPHIGSNRLPKVITAFREHLESVGTQFEFESRVVNLLVDNKRVIGVKLADGREFTGRSVVVATGHSARDVIYMLEAHGVMLEQKAFAMGVRIEHPQPLINEIQYGKFAKHPKLRAAPYKLAYTPSDGQGVFSFCMCPGGWIVPASTTPGELVVNGMSLSRRDSPFANSGLVASASGGFDVQRRLEQAAWQAGGGGLVAPAIRVADFVAQRQSQDLPKTSYQPGIKLADMDAVLNASGLPIATRLREALRVFDQKMPGYITNEAILVAPESRTSSPVRVVRDSSTLQSPNMADLYPCGEGAGYAGGIVSAAMDGMHVARAINAQG